MTIKASGRSALMLTTGTLDLFGRAIAVAADAATDTTAERRSRSTNTPSTVASLERRTRIKIRQGGQKAADDKKADDGAAAGDSSAASLPPSVANANAQLAAGNHRLRAPRRCAQPQSVLQTPRTPATPACHRNRCLLPISSTMSTARCRSSPPRRRRLPWRPQTPRPLQRRSLRQRPTAAIARPGTRPR